MQKHIVDCLRCPDCRSRLELTQFDAEGNEILAGVLHCNGGHFFPIAGGIPRMLPSSIKDHWDEIQSKLPKQIPDSLKSLVALRTSETRAYDTRTKANFSNEWDNHDIVGRTWTMELDDRIEWFFLDPIRIPKAELNGKRMLDAGCGNGRQSVAYTEFGLEVFAIDLSTGLEKGYEFRKRYSKGKPENVHFIQGDLQHPPFAEDMFDIIHSAGVLHHTPNTETTFRALRPPLLRENGTFYVWLYKFENVVTPIVNSIRFFTTRIPAPIFAIIANLMAIPFIIFCWTVNALGIRQYAMPNLRESALALHDIFGAPYAHYHSLDEVADWYKSTGFGEIWGCNDDRRGFGVCGKLASRSLLS